MKRMKFVLACSLLLGGLAVGAIQSSYVKKVNAEELVYKTLTFPDGNSDKISSYTKTWSATIDGFTWNIGNFNNNNNAWSYIKAGSKNAASTATITTASNIDKEISAVKVTVDAVTDTYIDSTSLTVASDANFTNVLATVEKSAEKGTMVYEIAEPVSSAYYRLTYNCKKGASNGLIQISKVEYCYETINPDLPTYTTTFFANDETEGTYSVATVNAGQEVPFPEDPTREGYIFEGWYTDPVDGNKVTSIAFAPEQDSNLYAHWKKETAEDIFVKGDTTAKLSASYTKIGSETEKVYKKVTEDLTDWSGEYLIVYEAGNKVFDGSRTTVDSAKNYKDVTIEENQISATENENYKFTIEKLNDGYSIKSSSDYYIGQKSNANGLVASQSTQYSNKISLNSSGSVDIISEGGAYLRYNKDNGQERFRFFKSSTYDSQQAIHLYKAEGEGAVYTITDATIRYGAIMPETAYNANATYGLIVMSGSKYSEEVALGSPLTEVWNVDDPNGDGLISTQEMVANVEAFYGSVVQYDGLIPARTDAEGNADENGSYYQFGIRFTDALTHIDTALCAFAYMEVEGQVYLTSETNYSLRTLAEEYLTRGILSENADAQGVLKAIVNYGL